MKPLLSKAAETLINGCLKNDPEIASRLFDLDDKSIGIDLIDFNLFYKITFKNEKVFINKTEHEPCSVVVRGKSLDLIMLLLNKKPAKSVDYSPGVSIEGDLHLLQVLKITLMDLDTDLSSLLAPYCGDFISDKLSQFFKGTKRLFKKNTATFQENVKSFLQEELRALPTNVEVVEWKEQVKQLRHDVERLEAKLSYLSRQIL